jgi:IclR family transcriptional regulator, acetate operon repressor
MERPTMQDTSSSLRRALSLLDTFTAQKSQMSIRELSRRSGVPRSTTHRLVGELVEWGALEQGPGGVRLGVKLFELGTLAPSQATLREAASPFLHTLNEVTRLTANLAVREGDGIVYLDKIATRSLKVPHSRMGGRGLLHATALGKAILAFSPAPELPQLPAGPLASLTPRTVVDEARLREDLRRIRSLKVAYDLEESRLGLFCVAAPVLDAQGTAIAAVSVTGATEQSQAEHFAPTVIATAHGIARAVLGRDRATRRT